MTGPPGRPLRRLGVLGWPVAHSRSPAMHNAALRAMGLGDTWRYGPLPVPPELFVETVRALGAIGYVGANVTIPHKHAALELADSASGAAREIGAANTLTFAPSGEIHAENTDAPGLLAALKISPKGLAATVLGAGGSARAAVWALIQAGAREVSVVNRDHERARALTAELGGTAVAGAGAGDILVNCTAIGLEDPSSAVTAFKQLGISNDVLSGYPYVVDLVYRDGSSALLEAAARQGAATVDGLEVLVCQGALSLQGWTGRPVPIQEMRRAAAGAP